MKAYLSAKFSGDDNEEIVESLCTAASRAGFDVTCTNRDYDDYGRGNDRSEPLTEFMFTAIEQANVVLLDITDKGVGIGIEAGYAAANQIPIVLLSTHDAELSPTIEQLATKIIEYQGFEDLTQQLSALKASLA